MDFFGKKKCSGRDIALPQVDQNFPVANNISFIYCLLYKEELSTFDKSYSRVQKLPGRVVPLERQNGQLAY